MLSFIKKVFPLPLRRVIWKIFFSKYIIKLENLIFKSKPLYDIKLPEDADRYIDDFTKSLMRRNLYERCELKALKLLNFSTYDFIDIGSSLGYIASKVSIQNFNKKLILIEPDIDLLRFTERIFEKQNQNSFRYYNNAIYYGDEEIFLEGHGKSLEKKITTTSINDSKINPISLNKIISENNIDKFNLLIDAEGYSFDPLFHEMEVFVNCQNLIIDEFILGIAE